MTPRIVRTIAFLTLLALGGCGTRSKPTGDASATIVAVSQPIQRDVTDYIDYIGRTDAVNSVDIRPRVTGYLVKMPFKEGSDVKAGDLLFEVDPRPYQAQYDQAAGQVKLAQAQLKLAKADYQRALVVAKTPGAISQQDLDKYLASQEEAEASVEARQASMEQYKLNLDFCQVTSPIAGMVSRYYLTLGNSLGGHLLRRQPLRWPLLAQLSHQRQRTALELHQLHQGRGRQSRLVLYRQGAGLLRRRKLGGLYAVAQGRQAGDVGAGRKRQGHAGRGRDRAGSQLYSRHRLSRRRHLGRDRKGFEPRDSTTSVDQ